MKSTANKARRSHSGKTDADRPWQIQIVPAWLSFLFDSVPELEEILIQTHFLVTAGNGLPLASILNFYRSGELSQAAQYLKLSTAADFRHLIRPGIQLLFELLGRLAFLGNEFLTL